jgi:hypothetical protein
VNQNVTIPNRLNIQKGQFLLPFFFASLINKILKFLNKNCKDFLW